MMKFLLLPGIRCMSNWSGISWNNSTLGCNHLLSGKLGTTISVRSHCTTTWSSFSQLSPTSSSGLNHRKGEFCSWKRPQGPSPYCTDEDLPNFSKSFYFNLYILCIYEQLYIYMYIYIRQTTTKKHIPNL